MTQLHVIDHMGIGGAQQMLRLLLMHDPSVQVLALRERAHTREHPRIHTAASLWQARKAIQQHHGACIYHLPKSLMLGALTRHQGISVAYEHGSIWQQQGMRRLVYHHALQRMDGIIATSEALIPDLQRAAPDAHCYVLRPAIPSLTTTPSPAVLGGKRLGYLGRLSHEKGVDILLEALAKLPAPYTLTICGDGNERSSLERLAEYLDVHRRVAWLGSHPASTLWPLIDILVIPSRAEAVSLAALEAMQAGRLVVAADTAGLLATLHHGKAGLLVRANSSAALAQGILMTENLTQSEHEQILNYAARDAQPHTPEQYVHELTSILQKSSGLSTS